MHAGVSLRDELPFSVLLSLLQNVNRKTASAICCLELLALSIIEMELFPLKGLDASLSFHNISQTSTEAIK